MTFSFRPELPGFTMEYQYKLLCYSLYWQVLK